MNFSLFKWSSSKKLTSNKGDKIMKKLLTAASIFLLFSLNFSFAQNCHSASKSKCLQQCQEKKAVGCGENAVHKSGDCCQDKPKQGCEGHTKKTPCCSENKNQAQKCESSVKKSCCGTSEGHSSAKGTTVYYFHKAIRCDGCVSLENKTKAALETKFKNELNSKEISFVAVDMDDENNQHFIEKYGVNSSSVLIVQNSADNNNWKKLDLISEKANNDSEFNDYLYSELETFRK